MDELDSNSQLVYNGLEFAFVQVVLYQGSPDIEIDGELFDVYGYQKWRRDKSRPYSRLKLIPNGGRLVVLVGQYFEDADVQQQGGAALGATNTNVNEIDSGPIAVAVGAVSTRIVVANPNRTRGVTIQNVGLNAVAVGKGGAGSLTQALAGAGYILSADSAANAGNGGSVVFDGWQGEVWAVNVAGGPGSVLVSAF